MTAILVTGSTGTLGRALVPRLAEAGHKVRSLSRRPPAPSAPPGAWATGDLRRNVGLDQAVAGMDVIVHCATAPISGDRAAARNLIAAARRARAPHLVYISIVGVDRVPLGYYRAKLAVERLIEDSGLPWTVLRATQFHELILRGCELLARLPVLPVRLPGRAFAGFRRGGHLAPDQASGTVTFDEFLAARFTSRRPR